jgi:hypothetical protein
MPRTSAHPKEESFNFRVPSDLKAAFKAATEEDDRPQRKYCGTSSVLMLSNTSNLSQGTTPGSGSRSRRQSTTLAQAFRMTR